ncbi:hypothetical protein SGRI78S_03277 [Streptomyces griseus subsp. griseus]
MCVVLMASATSARRPQRVTSQPASARITAKAVPHEPVPKTAAFTGCVTWVPFPEPCAVAQHGLCGDRRGAGRLLAAQVLQLAGDRRHDDLGHLAEHLGGRLQSVEAAEVDGRSRLHLECLAGEQPELVLLGVRRHREVGAPLGDGDDGRLGHQGDPGGPGLAGHRPHVGVPGEGALGVEGDALAALDGVHGGPEGVQGVGGLAVDGDLAGAAQHHPDERGAEEGCLRQEPRHPPGVVLEVAVGERVQIGVVVDRGDESAVGRNVFHPPPVALEQNHQWRLGDDRRQAVPEADSAAGHSDTFLRNFDLQPGY